MWVAAVRRRSCGVQCSQSALIAGRCPRKGLLFHRRIAEFLGPRESVQGPRAWRQGALRNRPQSARLAGGRAHGGGLTGNGRYHPRSRRACGSKARNHEAAGSERPGAATGPPIASRSYLSPKPSEFFNQAISYQAKLRERAEGLEKRFSNSHFRIGLSRCVALGLFLGFLSSSLFFIEPMMDWSD